nr:efflux RND transporter periplasmic adaptor subunit [Petrachloros mirabilis]
MATATAIWIGVRQSGQRLNLEAFTVPAETESLTLQISASGTIVPVQSVNLSPQTSGILQDLLVEQGDRVEQGQVIARMDDRDLLGQQQQAMAGLDQTQARLAQLRAGNRPEEIAQAQARLQQAEAQLSEVRAGNRPEEVDQAQSQLAAATAQAELAASRVERFRFLASQGAESQDRLDQAIAENNSAQANQREAERRLALLRQGSRVEAIQRAEAAVVEARQAYELLRRGTRIEEIAQAEAAVNEARGRLQVVQTQLDDTVIRAPFAGIITQKYATEGAFVTPTTTASATTSATSTSIVALATTLEVLAEVPEVDIGQIRPGQAVEVRADAFPGEGFQGQVRLVSPEAVVEQNVTFFQVRVRLQTGQGQLLSGMNTDLTFLGDTVADALVVPTVAIVTERGQTGVYVPDSQNRPQFRSVTIGSSEQDKTQILDGLSPNERVFIDFPPGQRPQAQPN